MQTVSAYTVSLFYIKSNNKEKVNTTKIRIIKCIYFHVNLRLILGGDFLFAVQYCFWITMSMMYSDYCKTAKKHGVDRADFYADLACDFLFDVDRVSPTEKLYWYFEKIAKH